MFDRIKIAAIAALAISAGSAQAAGFDYANIQGALGLLEDVEDPISAVVTGGKYLPTVGKDIAFEAEFIDSITASEDALSYWGLAGYGVLRVPMDQQNSFRVRAGLRYLKMYGGGQSEDDMGISFGFGMVHQFAARTGLIVEYTYLEEIEDMDVSQLSSGVQFRF